MNTPPTPRSLKPGESVPGGRPVRVQAYADTNGDPPAKPDIIRLTIPVQVRVHEAFSRISKATSVPIGRCMGDWMRDTIDAAEYMAEQLEGARAAPRIVAQKLHAYALGLTDETGSLIERLRAESRSAGAVGRTRSGPSAPGFEGLTPPVSNTGVKVQKTHPKGPRGSK